ncbi:MAG TPA: tetratricopeptide repeat protein [Thermoanaerobaculia bacterium]
MRKSSFRAIAALGGIFWVAAAAPARPCRFEEGQALIAAGKTSEGRPILEDCASGESPNPRAAFLLGQSYFLGRDPDRAALWLERAATLEPTSSETQYWLGRAYGEQALRASVLHQPGLARKVHRAFERAVELDPENLSARMALVEYGMRAPAFLGGSAERARLQAEEIRRRDPLKGHHAFGLIAEHQKRFDAAAREYEDALREFPDSADPVYWRVELARRQKDSETAFTLLERLTSAEREEPEALYLTGELAASTGLHLDRGEACLHRYLRHAPSGDEPSLAAAHFQLGAIHVRRKERGLAREEYNAALEKDPTLTEARQALLKLK